MKLEHINKKSARNGMNKFKILNVNKSKLFFFCSNVCCIVDLLSIQRFIYFKL